MGVVTEYDADEQYDEYGQTRAKLCSWSKDLDRHWGDWIKEANECNRYVAGDQYSTEERHAIKDGGKIPVTFNRIGPVIDAVVGTEIQGRQQVKYQPREIGDALPNEILTEGAEWIRDLSDAEGEESDAKRDAFICGLGAVSTEIEYEEDPQGKIVYRCLEPGTALPDPRARQANAVDARYVRYRDKITREEFKELYGDRQAVFDPVEGGISTYNSDPRLAYSDQDSTEKDAQDDLVTIDLWQWYEVETVIMSMSQDGSGVVAYSLDDFDRLQEAGKQNGYAIDGVRRRRRKYMTAVMSGQTFLEEPRQMEMNKFTIKFITGKRDKDKGVWYGLVRPMIDPQKWANSFFSMLLHMVRTNAKGGIMAEEGAIGDRKQFEASYAKSDEVTVVADGAISDGRVTPKPQPQYPTGIDRLMQQAIEAIRDVTGVNAEMLGLADREQPGVLEAQRKQAAYGLLATFFESFRRYRKLNGELLLDFLGMLGPETLLRVTGEGGIKQQYVPLAAAMASDAKYDVIVDEMPAGPNQKDRTWGMFTQLLPVIGDRLSPEAWAEFMKYSPFPESLSIKLRELLLQVKQQDAQPDPKQEQMFMAQLQNLIAQYRKTNAEAISKEVETQVQILNPDPRPQIVS